MVSFSPEIGRFPASRVTILLALRAATEDATLRMAWEKHSGVPMRWAKQYFEEHDPQPRISAVNAGFSGAFHGPDRIELAESLLQTLEDAPQDPAAQHEVKAVALHEMVHWGAWQAGDRRPDSAEFDRGFAFEGDAFKGLPEAIHRLSQLAGSLPAAARALAAAKAGAVVTPPPAPLPPPPAPQHPGAARFTMPQGFRDAPLARLSEAAAGWPVRTGHARRNEIAYRDATGTLHGDISRTFGAARAQGTRIHAGIDLHCQFQDPVLAVEDGVVVNVFQFTGKSSDGMLPTDCVLLQTDSGLVLNHGELLCRDDAERKALIGRRVRRGDMLGTIGMVTSLKAMLHFEVYAKGTTLTSRWPSDTACPATLLDPTLYLLELRRRGQDGT